MSTETVDRTQAIVKRAVAMVGQIATLPEVTTKVMDVVEDPNGTAADLREIIKCDPVLSAKILSVVNSAFYGLPGQVASLERAIVLLGSAAVKNIAVAASLSRMFKGPRGHGGVDPRELWKHSVAVAVAAKAIDAATKNIVPPDEAFLAGLIHDLGLLVERQVFGDKLAEVVRRCREGQGVFIELEREIIGATHQEFGEALTLNWKFPRRLRAAIGAHHNPETLPENIRPMSLIISCADLLSCHAGYGFDATAGGDDIAPQTLDGLGISSEQLSGIRDTLEDELAEAESVLGSSN